MELAIFLRSEVPDHIIQLERPITDFNKKRNKKTKKEIDICILDKNGAKYAAIEIKYPKNGRIPETMFDYCKDLEFCEALIDVGFPNSYALILTEDKGFYEGGHKVGIYRHFRGSEPITGHVRKPTGKRDKQARIVGEYNIAWVKGHKSHRYAIVEIKNKSEA